jgi:arylsulfatase A-like enzyme
MIPRMRRIISLLLGFVCTLSAAALPAKPERHVVVVVWDGMRPDFVSEQNTPTLWEFAREGVIFRDQHAVYPSATMVNGTAIVTGVYPGTSGVIANHVYRRDIDPHHAVDVEFPPVVNKGDDLSGGKYISVPTIARLVQGAGGRTVMATAKSVGLLLDRQFGVRREVGAFPKTGDTSPDVKRQHVVAVQDNVTLFAGKSLPNSALAPITDALGPFPVAHLQHDAWTTKALTNVLWKDDLPAISVLWLGEPDLTQHESAPGAPAALDAIKSADQNLAAILSELDQRKARRTSDVFVVSDHGFSTIKRSIDLRRILNDAGFAAKTEFEVEPKSGDIMLAGNGGSVLFYIIGHDEALVRRLVEFLQQSDFAGVIFTKEPMEGTFGLEQAMLQNDYAPDVVMAFRWENSKNPFGILGMIDADWQRAPGKGTHATLSPFDMHNTLIAVGPDFQRGHTDKLPTGNTDLAPTILQILGIKPLQRLDGRILSEAMVGSDTGGTLRNGRLNSRELGLSRKPETKTIEATKHFPSGTWRQSLQISRVGSTIYLDQGNGAFVASEGAATN